MIDLIKNGGPPILFVLLFGLITLVVAGFHVFRPDEKKLGFLRAMSAATVFSILAAVAACLAKVMLTVPRMPELAKGADPQLIVMIGIGESLSPAILGFALLGLAWLMIAVGIRRL